MKRNSGFTILALSVFLLNLSMGLHTSVFNNYAAQELNLHPEELGILESFRETPGLLIAFISAFLGFLSKQYIAMLSFILASIGFSFYSKVSNLSGLIYAGVTWSLGIHLWMTLSPIFTLSFAEGGERGRRLGQINSITAFSSLTAMVLVFLTGNFIPFRKYYLIAGILPIIGAFLVLKVPYKSRVDVDPPSLVFKKDYMLYYVLNFLEGSRRQVFATFALFVLTRVYGVPIRHITLLLIINGIANILVAPRAGKLIDRVGERIVLLLSYTGALLIFIGYATTRSVTVLSILYCLDNIMINFSLALTTYIDRISILGDLSPNISMGVTVNHIAAVLMPLVGGILWERFGYQTMFMLGALIVLISIFFANKIKPREESITV
ncbi:MAG TPA: MFS transporter [bacterium]|jgi:predicted MFS family arabinose efflux permease|nr:MFS transporter [Dictyoglomota bacterium]HHV80292.1 MFS transporter [bacterium]HOP55247.1 MFS transporter [bacterium]HRU32849.1 MFS transporter [bacterium]